jgi:hypothetical protein
MKNKKFSIILFFILVITILTLLLSSCTKNQRVKKWGGSATIELPAGQKLIHCTWKDSNLWYLTRPMNKKDSVEIYTFQEKSNLGLREGTYTIKERK